MCENKKECPTARMLRVPQSTRWDSDLVDRMFADLPFKPCDTSLQSSNRVDDYQDSPQKTTSLPGKRPLSRKFNQLNSCPVLGKMLGRATVDKRKEELIVANSENDTPDVAAPGESSKTIAAATKWAAVAKNAADSAHISAERAHGHSRKAIDVARALHRKFS